MRVVQLLPTISYGDAVGNDTRAIKELLSDMGYETAIYAENIDQRLPSGTAFPVAEMPELSGEDVIIYHGSTGTELNYRLPELGGRKMMIYHNITPPEFFEPYSLDARDRTADGLRGIMGLADKLEYCVADSEFNKRDLLFMGFDCPIDVCPILIPFEDYEKTPSQKIIRSYSGDSYTNLLFVGRIAPNKRQENVIRAFYFYKKYFNPKSRLFLVGDWGGMERYHDRLVKYTDALGLSEDDVIFTGHIKFNEILAYYKTADVFLCMSEHEGFCVPLVEAMYFDVPVVAYDCAAVPDTLDGSGVLLETTDPREAAERIDEIVRNKPFRQELIFGQNRRLEDFSYRQVSCALKAMLSGFIEGKNK